jgi:hypothetical protein
MVKRNTDTITVSLSGNTHRYQLNTKTSNLLKHYEVAISDGNRINERVYTRCKYDNNWNLTYYSKTTDFNGDKNHYQLILGYDNNSNLIYYKDSRGNEWKKEWEKEWGIPFPFQSNVDKVKDIIVEHEFIANLDMRMYDYQRLKLRSYGLG